MKNYSYFTPIVTERLLLSPFNYDDATDFWKIINNHDVSKYLPGIYVVSEMDLYENLRIYKNENGRRDYYLAIRKRVQDDSGKLKLIGAIIANKPIMATSEKALEVSYVLGEEYQGCGYMQEALKGFVAFAKGKGYEELVFSVQSTNTKSINVLKRIGAKFHSSQPEINEIKNLMYILDLNQT